MVHIPVEESRLKTLENAELLVAVLKQQLKETQEQVQSAFLAGYQCYAWSGRGSFEAGWKAFENRYKVMGCKQ